MPASHDLATLSPIAPADQAVRVRRAAGAGAGARPAESGATQLSVGPITVDLPRHEVRHHGRTADLSPTEFRLLELFLRHPNEALSRQRIRNQVWGYADEPEANAVDQYVHYLRPQAVWNDQVTDHVCRRATR